MTGPGDPAPLAVGVNTMSFMWRTPAREALDVVFGHQVAIHVAQQRLKQNLDGERQALQVVGQPQLDQVVETIQVVLVVERRAAWFKGSD